MTNENWLPEGGKWSRSHTEYILSCPICHAEGKFSWNPSSCQGHCWACHTSAGSVRKLEELFKATDWGEQRVTYAPVKRGVAMGEFMPVVASSEASRYLASRNAMIQINDCGALWSPHTRRIHFPIWSPFGDPLLTIGRAIAPDVKVRWLSPLIGKKSNYLFGALPQGDTVILTEGVFHVLSSGLWGKAVALLGKAISADIAVFLLNHYKKVVLWLDAHEPNGLKAQLAMQGFLAVVAAQFSGVCIYSIVSTKELGETDPEEVQRRLREAGC